MSLQNNDYQQQFDYLRDRYNLPATQVLVFPCLTSTNTKAWELLQSNRHQLPIAVIAIEQTAGKGQWGKTWQSTPGGLYMSVVMAVELPLEDSFHLVMATAVGITELLHQYDLPVEIKWSNDLILAECKLGGIKLETKTQGSKINYAVVGVGINWHNVTPQIGISLKEYAEGNSVRISSIEELSAIATVGILQGYQTYVNQGSEFIYQKYQKLLNSIGRQVSIKNDSGTTHFGVVAGVTRQGKLAISLSAPGASSTVYVSPGEISLGYETF